MAVEQDTRGVQEEALPQTPASDDGTAPEPSVKEAGAEQPGREAAETPSYEQLLAQLTEARARADESWGQFVRTRAELDNLRKRHQRELEQAHRYALDGFVRDLLPVRDSLEMGHIAAQEEGVNLERLREGQELTLRMLGDAMAKFGVEPVEPQGQPFNPELHQALSVQARSDVPPNTVVSLVQKGYRLHGRLVRPALVIVSAAVGQPT